MPFDSRISLVFGGLSLSTSVMSADFPTHWMPLGISGGGVICSQAISPLEPDRMMAGTDMSGAYMTDDAGRNWRMISYGQLQSNTQCRPAFDPVDPLIIYSATAWEHCLAVTRDGGATWTRIGAASLRDADSSPVGEIRIDPDRTNHLLVGSASQTWRSSDAGLTWTRCAGPTGRPIAFCIDRTSALANRRWYAGTTTGIWRSNDDGVTWNPCTTGLPWNSLHGFAGGSNAHDGLRLYCTIDSRVVNGEYRGGPYVSTDGGDHWSPVAGVGLQKDTTPADAWPLAPVTQYLDIFTTDTSPKSFWVFNLGTGVQPPHHTTVWRSDDEGRTCRPVFQADPRFPHCNVDPDMGVADSGQYTPCNQTAAICPSDNNRLVMGDWYGRSYLTIDGGLSWRPIHSRPAPGQSQPLGPHSSWVGNGLMMESCWQYACDPFQGNRHYIAYTDLGFGISTDHGLTWRSWHRAGGAIPPWSNTCYQLAFDPVVAGRSWGAFSDVHDIPTGNIITNTSFNDNHGNGGVCRSDDSCETWTTTTAGMPNAPCTSLVLDPNSAPGSRTLYAGLFGRGVWKSTDGGAHWNAANTGLGSNPRVIRLELHADGTLFALVTGMLTDSASNTWQTANVGLFRSQDGGSHWSWLTPTLGLTWPRGLSVDPNDSNRLFIGAYDWSGHHADGLWRTTDGGAHWSTFTAIESATNVHFHPQHPHWLYLTCLTASGPGLWLSQDDGATFHAAVGLPFNSMTRVTVDPADGEIIYVTTFGGGVWRGPASLVPTLPPPSLATSSNSAATPTLSGATAPLAHVVIRDGSTLLASIRAGEDGRWTWTPSQPLTLGSHSLTATASDDYGATSPISASVNITAPGSSAPPSLPTGWTAGDIGVAARTGTAGADGGTWTLTSRGSDVWDSADGCAFASLPVAGDVQITARLVALAADDAWAKAGVMIRETMDPGSRHAFACATANFGAAQETRNGPDAASAYASGPLWAPPVWLRAERAGGTVTTSASKDGTTWTTISQATPALSARILVGLAAAPHRLGGAITAQFTDVRIVTASTGSN